MSKEIDDIEFDELLAEKRHKEVTQTLKGIATLLNKPEKNDGVKEAVEKQSAAIEKVATAIQNLPKPEKPEVNVSVENKEIIPLLREIKEGNERILKALENKPMVDKFNFEHDNWGNIKAAKVDYKSGIIKPKYQA